MEITKDNIIHRKDGRIEVVCEHGVGHTIAIPGGLPEKDKWTWWVHGCDGCCSDDTKNRIKEKENNI